MNCKLCNTPTFLFHKDWILKKYEIGYYKCSECEFIQTEKPYWLNEAYTEAIATTDVGLVSRNLLFRDIMQQIIVKLFPSAKRMLDYGGGYGLFVRLMRDIGFDFYRQDCFCKNIFAQYFDLNDTTERQFDILTAFEVFEHLAEPLSEIEAMISYSPTVIFSTILAPDSIKEFRKWWYLASLSGQHISFYRYKSLQMIAKKFNKRLYSNGINLHLLTDAELDESRVKNVLNYDPENKLNKLIKVFTERNNPSYVEKDHTYIIQKLQNG